MDCGGWISVLFHKLRKRVNADVQRLGLTGIQSRVIHFILIKSAEGPVYQRDVESAFGVSRSTVTGMLQQMEKNGLIQRSERRQRRAPEKSDSHRKGRFGWTHRSTNAFIAPSSASRRACRTHSSPRLWKPPRTCPPIWTGETPSGKTTLERTVRAFARSEAIEGGMSHMVKTLARSIREFKKPAILTPLLVTVEVILECIIPFTIANLVNQMQAGCGMDVIVRYGVQLLVMAVLSLIFGVAAGNTCATASTGFARNLRQDMFYRIQDYSFENIDKFSVSSLVTRMTTDVVNVQMSFMMIIRVAIRGPLMLIFSFIMGFAMGGRLAMIFLVTIPLLGIGLVLVIRKATPIFRRVFRKYDALNDSVQENVQAMRVVKSYVREEYEKKKFAAAAEDVCKDFTRAERIMALNNPMMQFCVYAGMVFVLSFGSYCCHHQPGHGGRRGADVRHPHLQLPDSDEPDDAVHGVRDDHHVHGIRGAHRGGAQRKEQPDQPRKRRDRGEGRLD